MAHHSSSSELNSSLDPKKEEESMEKEHSPPPSPLFNQATYEEVLQEIGKEIDDVEAYIASFPESERTWYEAEVQKNVAYVESNVRFFRHPQAKATTKYKKMVLAQKKKAAEELKRMMADKGVPRTNPRRAIKHVHYKEDSDNEMTFAEESDEKTNAKKKGKQSI